MHEIAYLLVSEEDRMVWTQWFTAITNEHKEEGALEQLAAGRKVWFVACNPMEAAAGGVAAAGAVLSQPVEVLST